MAAQFEILVAFVFMSAVLEYAYHALTHRYREATVIRVQGGRPASVSLPLGVISVAVRILAVYFLALHDVLTATTLQSMPQLDGVMLRAAIVGVAVEGLGGLRGVAWFPDYSFTLAISDAMYGVVSVVAIVTACYALYARVLRRHTPWEW